jgi:hypothetical protein
MKKKWTKQALMEESAKYKTRMDFATLSQSAYSVASRMKILDIVCSHMPPSKSERYSQEELASEAIKYVTRGDFRKGSMSAYNVSHRRGILDQICGHMIDVRVYRTIEEIAAEALKYMTRGDFQKGNRNAYGAARTHNVLDVVCSHMKRSCGTSTEEKELLAAISSNFVDVKKIRDMKILIPGKPHIKGFEIDIYLPKLKKGIEFDGTYYHSFEVMRKCNRKKDWPDEDILNYHQIKDGWFSSKGIQILHIKEEDWIADKESCIKKCLDFLGAP